MRGRTNVTQRSYAYANGNVLPFTVATGNNISIGDFVQYKLNSEYKNFSDSNIEFYEQYNYSGDKYALIAKNGNFDYIYLVEVSGENLTILDFIVLDFELQSSQKLGFYAEGNEMYFVQQSENLNQNSNIVIKNITITNDELVITKNYSGTFGRTTSSGSNMILLDIVKLGSNFVLFLIDISTSSGTQYPYLTEVIYSISGTSITYSDSKNYRLGITQYKEIIGFKIKSWVSNNVVYGICMYLVVYSSTSFASWKSTTFVVENYLFKNVQVDENRVGTNMEVNPICRNDRIIIYGRGVDSSGALGLDFNGIYIYALSNLVLSRVYEITNLPYTSLYTTYSIYCNVKSDYILINYSFYNSSTNLSGNNKVILIKIDNGVVTRKDGELTSTIQIGSSVCFFENGKFYVILHTNTGDKYLIYNEDEDGLYPGEVTNYVESYNGGKTMGFAKTGGSAGDIIQVYTPINV